MPTESLPNTCLSCTYEAQAEQTRTVYESCSIANGKACTVCVQYSDLESQIQETKRILEKQLEKLRELREAMNWSHDRIVSKSLTEITSIIFQHTLPTLRRDTNGSEIDVWKFIDKKDLCWPLKLGAVSRAWRQIAWSTPQLWTFVCQKITFSKASTPELMEDWLSRAGNLPLSIWLHISAYDETYLNLEKVVNLVNAKSHRWYEFGIYGPSQSFQLFSGNSSGAPILHTLELHSNSSNENDGFFRVNGQDPRPLHVSIHTFHENITARIDWENITRLKISSNHVQQCLELVRYTPNLEHWCLANIFTTLVRLIPITLSKLRTLEIFNVLGVRALLQTLVLPGLTALHFDNMHSDDDIHRGILCLHPSSVLKSLSFQWHGNTERLIEILRHFPHLEELEVALYSAGSNDTNLFFSLLSDTKTGTGAGTIQAEVFLPSLKSLSYRDYDASTVNWASLSTLSTKRRPLRKLTADQRHYWDDEARSIFCGRTVEKHVLQRFLKLEEAGVCLNLPIPVRRNDLLDLLARSDDDNNK
ncbi:hypothetical protein JR316_0000092 [Psilocybe cubensis]|uniref:Uncharacterized protein n=2 Tax=Psilocybe cubensis TaxID=181762 RepID=A0ACB8HE04_PSICU|nr:hypothetical protein JR316_0000092 [Psilocybe cubensis]KAH9486028.1 hypothetical protein JR316_0000092 [Psilocybe cubensis]